MTAAFQAFAVRGASGPVVTLQAGVDVAGYFWTTTSRSAAKIKALRRDPAASILSRKKEKWTLRAGRGVIIDPAHPSDAVRELPAFAFAGTALALIAAHYPEELWGYVIGAGSTPKPWRLHNRVLIAVRHEDELTWTDDGLITHRTTRFADDDADADAHLAVSTRRHTPRPGACWLGLDSETGPLVLPGEWRSTHSMVRVPANVLHAVRAHLPGRACITIDNSGPSRPADKTGVIAKGEASPYRVRSGTASINVDVQSITTWSGFRSTVTAA